jgi:organic radical activating enzyme
MFMASVKKTVAVILVLNLLGTILMPYRAAAQPLSDAMPAILAASATGVVGLPYLKGIRLYKDNPFVFDFMISENNGRLSDTAFKQEADKLIKYFLASVTVPENDLWVNLSPYDPNRIAPMEFSQSVMGGDLLAQDYILKQLSASLTNPDTELGKQYWQMVNGNNSLNKVWIVPAKATVYEGDNSVVIGETRLKVMCDDSRMQNILPVIEKQINEGKEFEVLRQIYSAVILSTWYKNKLRQSIEQNILKDVYLDKKKVQGVNLLDPNAKDKIYQQYLKAFKDGAYNIVRLERISNKIIRRTYFSGGAVFSGTAEVIDARAQDTMPLTVGREVAAATLVSARAQDIGGESKADIAELIDRLCADKELSDSQRARIFFDNLVRIAGASGPADSLACDFTAAAGRFSASFDIAAFSHDAALNEAFDRLLAATSDPDKKYIYAALWVNIFVPHFGSRQNMKSTFFAFQDPFSDHDRAMKILDGDFHGVKPVSAHFIMSGLCNLNCGSCTYAHIKRLLRSRTSEGSALRHKALMSLDNAKNMLDKLKQAGVKEVIFTGGGEPLANPATIDAMAYAKGLGLEVGLFTNGELLTSETCRRLLEIEPSFVRVSVNAGSAHVHRIFSGIQRLPFNQIVANVTFFAEELVKLRKEKGRKITTFGLGFIASPLNFDEIPGLAKIARDICEKYPALA